jgi:uncharacterized protein
MAKLTRILSIDGGGIRGVIPAYALTVLEKKLQEKTGDPNARVADFFDLVAGTSIGGILTAVLLCPDQNNPKRPKFTAQDALNIHFQDGPKIFHASLLRRIATFKGVLDERYAADGLEETLSRHLGKVKLSELLKPCLMTAYDIERRAAKFFTQHDAASNRKDDFALCDVARATSAAPTYFEPALIASFTGVRYALADGGVFANNPALCAYAEVRAHSLSSAAPNGPLPTARDIAFLSLGTGSVEKPYPYEDAKNWGALGWVIPVLDIMLSGVSETVDYQLRQIFEGENVAKQYLRVEGTLSKKTNPDLDDASPENLQALLGDAKRIVKKFEAQLDDFIPHLLE